MFQRCATFTAPMAGSTASLHTQKRYITRLYTSYYRGQLFPNQLVRPKGRLPRGVGLSAARKGEWPPTSAAGAAAEKSPTERVSWRDADSTDLAHMEAPNKSLSTERGAAARPYVPLGEVAKMELKGDYLTEGGLHQEALESYGVVAKAYELAYPEGHEQVMGIYLKLAGALRRTGRGESSKALLLRTLAALDAATQPSLEIIAEALMELALTEDSLGSDQAGALYEEAVNVVDTFHNFGQSHKMLRMLPRLGRRFNLNYEQKFLYFSPFDYDRTFALVDQCLAKAEEFYRKHQDSEGVIRVLQHRKELIDKKFFNMRDFAGRIHTMRGHWKRRARVLTNAPTPDELLRYSPTVHQVHRDFKYELNAPIGREKEVQQGVNRVVMDMGNPYRRRGQRSKEMMRDADRNFAKYVRAKEFGA